MILTSNRRPVFADKIVNADDAVSIAYSIRAYEGETWTVSDGLTDYSFKTTEVPFGRALRIASELFANPVPVVGNKEAGRTDYIQAVALLVSARKFIPKGEPIHMAINAMELDARMATWWLNFSSKFTKAMERSK